MPVVEISNFELSAGVTCLDFANTLGDRPAGRNDNLRSYRDLVAWGVQAGTLRADTGRRLEGLARERPEAARRVLRAAIALRETIYRVFAAVAAGGEPAVDDLSRLNRAVGRAMSRLRLAPAAHGSFQWRWLGGEAALDSMLWQVASSAAELLVSTDRARVRECDGEGCSWLFLDRSPRGNRRWCDMASCGNRAKARRHYHRLRSRQRI